MARLRRRDRRQQVLLAERLHEVAEHAGLDGARDEVVLAVRSQHHDRDRPLVEDSPRRLDPVEPRHLHVHDREIGLVLAGELHSLLTVACLGTNLEPGASEHLDQVEPDDRLVFGDQDPHGQSVTDSMRTRHGHVPIWALAWRLGGRGRGSEVTRVYI